MSEHHEHEHSHTHEHTHNDGTVHSHAHTHEHEHDHEHEHSHGPVENREQIVALLNYMCKHNEAHEAELTKIIEKLETLDESDAATSVKNAQEFFAKGNAALKEAFKCIS